MLLSWSVPVDICEVTKCQTCTWETPVPQQVSLPVADLRLSHGELGKVVDVIGMNMPTNPQMTQCISSL